MSKERQNSEFQGNGLVALVMLGMINANCYIWFQLDLDEMSLFSISMYMLPGVIYSIMISASYYIIGFRGVFNSIVSYDDGGFGLKSSELLGDIFRLAAFLIITFWPSYVLLMDGDAAVGAISDSHFTHFWKMTLFFLLQWLFFAAWVSAGFFNTVVAYVFCGIAFYICTRLWDFATHMTADAETWWGKGIGFIAAFIIGGLIFIYAVRFWTAWLRKKAKID